MASHPNIVVICSDEHHPRMSGYRGHPIVQTPNLDRLAGSGAHFTRAYCTSPICTPSRMSFITGKYVHQIDNWMIGIPLSPDEMTWARRLDRAGVPSTMLGKMDFCGEYQDGGFTNHKILRRRGSHGEIPWPEPWKSRRPGFTRPDKRMHVRTAGSRSSEIPADRSGGGEGDDLVGNYDHDRIVTDWTIDYLRERGAERLSGESGAWALYVGLLMPHWPFRVPEPYFSRYYPDNIELPIDYEIPNPNLHPAVSHFQAGLDLGVIPDDDLRRTIAAYYGMISCMDAMVGEIIDELEVQGLADNTITIYTSDHGESLGEHGLFYKQCSYEGSVGVPLIITGPGISNRQQLDTPVDLVDLYPTVLDIAGLKPESDRPGKSWLQMIGAHRSSESGAPESSTPKASGAVTGSLHSGDITEPFAFSEFHGNLFTTDWYMIATRQYKYTYYVDDRPSLFDMEADPDELSDLATDSAYEPVLRRMESTLRSILDPEATAHRAKTHLGLIDADGTDFTKVPLDSG